MSLLKPEEQSYTSMVECFMAKPNIYVQWYGDEKEPPEANRLCFYPPIGIASKSLPNDGRDILS